MSLPSVIIGFLPTYSAIGLWAPILLVCCRILQSFSEGGETPGAAIFLVESAAKNRVSFYSALVGVAIYCGGIVGSLVGYVSMASFFPEWGWRVPFWMGGVLALVGFYIRMNASESPLFQKVKQKKELQRQPLLEALCNHKKSMICAFCVACGVCSIGSFNIAYIPFTAKSIFLLTTQQVLLLTTFFMLISICFLLIHGRLADIVGYRKYMAWGSILSSMTVPIILGSIDLGNFSIFVFSQSCLCLMFCALKAPLNAFSVSLLPTNVNFSGNAFAWGIGGALFGGLTPLICQLMKDWTGSFWGPSLYIIFCQLLALTAIYYAPNVLKEKENV